MSDSGLTYVKVIPFELPEIVPFIYTTIQNLYFKGNMGNISNIILIDISVKTDIVENIQIGANCNPEKITSLIYPFKDFHDVSP